MAIEDLREIGNVLYERRGDGMLYPVRRVRPDAEARAVPAQNPSLLNVGGIGERLGLLNQIFNPVEAIGQSMNAGERMMSPNMGLMDRIAALGDMLSGVAGVTGPAVVAGRAGAPAAAAVMEGLLGGSPTQQAASDTMRAVGRDVVERLNQPGQMPTVYSNPIPGVGRPPLTFDDVAREMQGADEILGLPDDEFVTLYHGTTKEGADRIKQTGKLKSAGEPSVYLTTDPKGGGYGDGTVVPVRVRRGLLQIDDEFPSGRADFRIDLDRPGGSVPVQIAETPTLPTPRNEAETMARDILQLRAEGRADEVTEPMMLAADPQYMYMNTPLPMDYASRMARAEEMGFDVGRTRYHGSEADINEVRTDLGDQERYRTGLFTSTNPDVADSYVSTSGGMIYPMVMRSNDGGAIIDAQGANWNRIPRDAPTYIPSSALAAEFPELAGDKFNTAYDVAPGLYDDLFNRGASTNALARQRRFEGDSNITFENVVDRGAALKNYLGETEEMARARSVSASMPSDVRVDFYGNQVRSPFARFDPEFRNLSNLSASLAAAGVPLGLLAMLPEEEQY
jgi:hypothetical protein